ncbi:MAG: lamin tail domain-containing protein [Patescibacteria group bacterium]
MPSRVLVSEIFYDAAGSDTGKEFIELYNDGNGDVDLKDWALQSNGNSLGKIGSKPEDKTIIRAHAYFLVGLNNYSGAPPADIVRSASLPNTSAAITLLDASGATADSVSYSSSVREGESYERESWSGSAFHANPTPSPQNSGN